MSWLRALRRDRASTLTTERVVADQLLPDADQLDDALLDERVPSGVVGQSFRPRGRRPFRKVWRRHKLGIIGLVMVGFIIVTAVLGPWLIPIDPNHQSLTTRLLPLMSQGPDVFHLLGTDSLGRDVLARVLAGSRASLGVVTAGLVLGAAIGILLGLLAGFYGKWLDNGIMRLVDTQLALPTLISAMFVAAILGTGYWNTAITLGVTSWPLYARLIRAEVLRLREEDFTTAAVALGARDVRLLLRHIVPNLVGTISVVASLELGSLILTESSLSYLGFGMQPPDATWGSMIGEGQQYVFVAPSLSVIPGLFIMTAVLGLNFVGDWLRDILGRQEIE